MKKVFAIISFGVLGAASLFADTNELSTSAILGDLNVNMNASIRGYNPTGMTLKSKDALLIDIPRIGIKTSQRDYSDLRLVRASEPQQTEEEYTMRTGKHLECYNISNDRTYTFVNSKGDTLNVDIRLFPDGLAFRYVLPYGQPGEVIEKEYTDYFVPDGKNRWFQPYQLVYEDFYPQATDGSEINRRQDHRWGYPALLQSSDSLFVLITESDIKRGHAGSLLSNAVDSEKFNVIYGGGTQNVGPDGWTSPWRLLIGGRLADVVMSTLVTDVATPAVSNDVDWVTPGPVSWIYWANNHGSNDLNIIKEYIDLAVDMKWPYMLIDAEWDEMKDGHTIEEAIAYAHQRGIKPMIWYNSTTGWIDGAPGPKYRLNTKEDREKEYQWLQNQGVVGVKIDFFDGDKVEDNDYCIDLLEDALKHNIMVTLHGATIPRGWQRTYPNLMTVEAVYGAEWYNNLPVLTNRAGAHNATLPFTRNVIGPMDYTPGTFTDSQHPHITSHGHELALPFLFESPLQHMPDRPSAYLNLPSEVRELLSNLPTAWDDTALLTGYPGHHAVIARQKDDVWYIAGINGTDEPMTIDFEIPLAFIEKYDATVYKDGATQNEFAPVEHYTLSSRDMSIPCLPRGGFVMVVAPN